LAYKGEIYTEAKDGTAGGTTSYMKMPNAVNSSSDFATFKRQIQPSR
jgi:dihydroorotase-like cyclic amidohydrolase